MATITQVFDLMQAGRTASQIMGELKIGPGRLDQILRSRKMRKIEDISRDLAGRSTTVRSFARGSRSFDRLAELSEEDSELGRRACVALLEQINLNYPPAAKTMPRSTFWD